jgi:enoyl-CoA hydratase/carnithine racemase
VIAPRWGEGIHSTRMEHLVLEVDGGVATLSINRPQARNALALQTMAEVGRAMAAAPPAAVAGIKRSVSAVHPHRKPELADETIAAFARTWADPAHWEGVERMEKRRRQTKW